MIAEDCWGLHAVFDDNDLFFISLLVPRCFIVRNKHGDNSLLRIIIVFPTHLNSSIHDTRVNREVVQWIKSVHTHVYSCELVDVLEPTKFSSYFPCVV